MHLALDRNHASLFTWTVVHVFTVHVNSGDMLHCSLEQWSSPELDTKSRIVLLSVTYVFNAVPCWGPRGWIKFSAVTKHLFFVFGFKRRKLRKLPEFLTVLHLVNSPLISFEAQPSHGSNRRVELSFKIVAFQMRCL